MKKTRLLKWVFGAVILSLNLQILQSQVRLSVPFGRFYGEGIENTSHHPLISLNCIATYNKHIPLDFDESNYFVLEAGIGAIGTKQSHEGNSYKANILSVKGGIYYRYDFLVPEFTPLVITGINVNALFASRPDLALKNDSETIVEEFDHKVIFPEYVIGIGWSFNNLSIDIRDHLGLISVDKDKNIKSNVISIGITFHLRELM